MDPLISLVFDKKSRRFATGEELVCEYQVDAVEQEEVQAIEASVLWLTEGKGDEDFSVHWFERRLASDAEAGDLRPLHRIRTRLPNSPVSYDGKILKIRWCVRVRVFLKGGKDICADSGFELQDGTA
jgi:hypothetical protein